MPEQWVANSLGWQRYAACRAYVEGQEAVGVPRDEAAELFFPYPEDCEGPSAEPAKRICGRCPVWSDCLEANLEERHGIFGGTTPKQRENIRANRLRWAKRRLMNELEGVNA